MDDMAAMRKAEPWLFVDAPSGGASARRPVVGSDGAWRPWVAGLGKNVFRLWRWLTFFSQGLSCAFSLCGK